MASRNKRAILYVVGFAFDLLAIVIGYAVALESRDQRWLEAGGQSILLIALPIFAMIAVAREVHSVETLESRFLAVQRSLGALGATALIVMGISFMVDADNISRLGFALMFGAAAVTMLLGKLIFDVMFRGIMGGQAISEIVLKDGLDVTAQDAKFVVDVGSEDLWPDPNFPEKIDKLSRLIAPYDRVIVACQYEHRQVWSTFLKGHDVGGEILLDRDFLYGAVAIGQFDDRDTLVVSLGPLNLFSRFQKRLFDIIIAAIAVVGLSPLFVLTALAIKLESRGPVLFRQKRVGQGSRQFQIFKFRSMQIECSDATGSQSTRKDDDRVTRVGKFIRRTSIDELPQLFNVLLGDMSLVGPRPHALGSRAGDQLFWHASEYYWMRHALKPGLTGLAQVRGFRGATNTEKDLQLRVRCDLEYLSNWSLWSDLIIILRTIPVMIHKNAY